MKIIDKETKAVYEITGRRSHGEEQFLCPKCSHDRKKSNVKCFGWNHDLEIGRCSHCESHFYSENIKEKAKVEKKTYVKPEPLPSTLSEKAEKYLISRGLTTNTIQRFKLSESKQFMPQVSQERNCIAFPYYKNEVLVNAKFRDGEKNFRMVKDAELILFNYDAGIGVDELYVTEGEFDSMSLYEAGIHNVCSVPDGAKKSENATLDWIANSWEVLEGKKKIILCFDNDEAGLAFREIVANRLGKDICCYVDFIDYKDANEMLIAKGPEYLKRVCLQHYDFPLEGIETIGMLESELDSIYVNGYPEGLHMGYESFDRICSWQTKMLCVITGIPSHGKSEFLDQIMVKMAEKHDWKFGVFSAENQPTHLHMAKIAEKHAGARMHTGKASRFPQMSITDYSAAKLFIERHFWFIKITSENSTVESLIIKAKELKAKYGIKGFVIDNWAKLKNKSRDLDELNLKINALSELCKTHDLLIFIVVHPVKMMKDKQTKLFEVPNLYSINGTSDWYNLVDCGLTVYRNFESGMVEVYVQKMRWWFLGGVGCQNFDWDANSGRYLENNQLNIS